MKNLSDEKFENVKFRGLKLITFLIAATYNFRSGGKQVPVASERVPVASERVLMASECIRNRFQCVPNVRSGNRCEIRQGCINVLVGGHNLG
jgi:hypothetical protein